MPFTNMTSCVLVELLAQKLFCFGWLYPCVISSVISEGSHNLFSIRLYLCYQMDDTGSSTAVLRVGSVVTVHNAHHHRKTLVRSILVRVLLSFLILRILNEEVFLFCVGHQIDRLRTVMRFCTRMACSTRLFHKTHCTIG